MLCTSPRILPRLVALPGLLMAVIVAQSALAADPVVNIGSGSLRGIDQGAVQAYLGIPFAKPPVGNLRWRAPAPPTGWKGERDATHFAANCYQVPATPFGPFTSEFLISGPSSEDCLYLNIWRPADSAQGLPVFVWIHGGGYGGGSGAIPIYNGAKLAAKGAVVVTINYRVGVFGFLAHPGLSKESLHHVSGNYGLLDMIAALQWVHAHIAAFGGDPARVTVGGQSAGASAVNDLMESPLAKGLFRAGIAQSGAAMGVHAAPLEQAEAYGAEFARKAGITTVAQLRKLPAAKLLTLSDAGPPTPGEKPKVRNLSFAPVLDHYVLSADPDDAASAPVVQVPLMTGFNADEGEIFGLQPLTPAEFEARVQARYGESAADFLAVYPHATPEEATHSAGLMGRDRYMANLVIWLEGHAHRGGMKLYPYLYEHPYPGPESARYGTFHTSEVPYIFGVLDQGGRPFQPADQQVSEQLSAYWFNFISKGNPNGAHLTEWPAFSSDRSAVMGLGDSPGERSAVSSPERLAAFRAYVARGGHLSMF